MRSIAILVLLSTRAFADEMATELDREDAPAGRNELGFDGGAPLRGWGASLGLGYVARPLVVQNGEGQELAPIHRRITMVIGGAVAIGERVVVDGRFPMARQIGRGLAPVGGRALDPWVAGDLRIAARVRFTGDEARDGSLFARAFLTLPTGNEMAFAGEAAATYGLAIIGRFRAENGVVLAASAGIKLRREETMIGDALIGNELGGALGVVIPVPGNMRASAEFLGAVGDASDSSTGPAPLEGRVGFGVVAYKGFEFGARIGAGFDDEIGAPKWRAMLEVVWNGDARIPLPRIGEPDDGGE